MAVALNLQRCGLSVTVIDAQNPERPASRGNAGHIAVEQIAPLASLSTLKGAPQRLVAAHGGLSLPLRQLPRWLPFSLRLAAAAAPGRFAAGKAALGALLTQAMPAWLRHAAAIDRPDILRQEGHFIAWCAPKNAARRRRAWLEADHGTASFRDADAEELDALHALCGKPIAGAVRCIGSGQILDLDTLSAATMTAFKAAGGTFIPAHAIALPRDGGRASVALSDGTRITADAVIVTAGVMSRPLLEQHGHKVPMIAERGYHLEYDPERWPASMPPVVFEEHALIVTRFAETVRACSFIEFSSPQAPADPVKWDRIAHSVRELRLAMDRPVSQWMGARPTLPDYLPAIGTSQRAANLYYAFGHQHLGLTLAPITGEIVAALVAGRTPPMPLAPFDLERFA